MSANSNIICIFPCKCSPFVLILLLGILPFLAFSFPQKSSALALAPSPSILIASKSAFKKSTDIFLVINKHLPTGILASNLLLVTSFLCFILISALSYYCTFYYCFHMYWTSKVLVRCETCLTYLPTPVFQPGFPVLICILKTVIHWWFS